MKTIVLFLLLTGVVYSQSMEETLEVLRKGKEFREMIAKTDSANADVPYYSLMMTTPHKPMTVEEIELTKKWESRLHGKGYLFYYRLEPYVLYVDSGRIKIKKFHESIVEIVS